MAYQGDNRGYDRGGNGGGNFRGGNNGGGGNRNFHGQGNGGGGNYRGGQGGGGNFRGQGGGNRNFRGQGGGGGNFRGGQHQQQQQDVPQITGVNKVLLTGYLLEEPTFIYSQNGTPVFRAKLAIPFNRGRDGGWGQNAFTIKAFDNVAEELGNSVAVNDWIKVVGAMRNESNIIDGNKRWFTTVIAESFAFVDPGNELKPVDRPVRDNAGPARDDDAPYAGGRRGGGDRDRDVDDIERGMPNDPDPNA